MFFSSNLNKLLFLHLYGIYSITPDAVGVHYSILLHGLGRLLFRLHKYSVTGLFASNVKVKLLLTIVDGLHTGCLISSTGHTVKLLICIHFVQPNIMVYLPCPVRSTLALPMALMLGLTVDVASISILFTPDCRFDAR